MRVINQTSIIMKKYTLISLVMATAATLNAQTIINVELGAGTAIGASDVAGVVPSAGWQLENGYPSFTNKALELDNGDPSGALLSGTGSGNVSPLGGSTATNDYTMFNRGLGITNTGSTLSVTDLPAAFTDNGYEVYVYFAAVDNLANGANNLRETISISDGTSTFYFDVDETQPSYQGSFIQATTIADAGTNPVANYAVFSGSAANFTITATNIDTTTNNIGALTGMQIVAVPEPSAFAGIFGLVALLAARRRA